MWCKVGKWEVGMEGGMERGRDTEREEGKVGMRDG